MSDHFDNQNAVDNPELDVTDFYAFLGTNGTAFALDVDPFSTGGGFNHEASYNVMIDRTGNYVPDMALRVTFGDRDSDGQQPVELRISTGAAANDPADPGRLLVSGRTGVNLDGCGWRLFAGLAADPFYINPNAIGAAKTAMTTGSALDLSAFDSGTAYNLFQGANVMGIVIEAPALQFVPGSRINCWGATWVPWDDGSGWRQLDSAANPLFSTIYGQGNDFSAAQPVSQMATYGRLIQEMTAAAVAANAVAANETSAHPQAYGALVAAALLPDVLSYTVGTPAYWHARRQPGQLYARNGRDLAGNHADEMFRLVFDMPTITDGLTAADNGALRPTFPYLSLPV